MRVLRFMHAYTKKREESTNVALQKKKELKQHQNKIYRMQKHNIPQLECNEIPRVGSLFRLIFDARACILITPQD